MKTINFFKASALFIIFYLLWFAYVVYWFTTDRFMYPGSCGAANGGLVVLTAALVGASTVTLLILSMAVKNRRLHFLMLLVLTLLIATGSFLYIV